MYRFNRFFSIMTIAALIAGCAGRVSAGSEVRSGVPRDEVPQVSDADAGALTEGNTAFALDLYRELAGMGGNLFYSPFSISQALAMTFAGARGNTASQMEEVLHFTLAGGNLHPAFNSLGLELASRSEIEDLPADQRFKLNIANAIWGQKDYEFLPEFLDMLAKNYGAGMRLVDYLADPEKARVEINNWVEDQTEGKIKDLIPQGAIDGLTRLVLTNAIYFNASWQHPFDESLTALQPFHLLDGGTVNVDMMEQSESFGYYRGGGYQAVELPYSGDQLAMWVILPDEDQFAAFEAALDPGVLDEIRSGMSYSQVHLWMPQFSFSAEFMLKPVLTALGMTDAFDVSLADFSGMTGSRDLFISEVIHKAFVDVDESGTEAAAATAVIMKLTAAPAEEPVELKIDRPFIFLIRDLPTGSILFLGRVLDPTAK